MYQVISAAGAVKHEDIVDQVQKLFTKLSDGSETVSQLVAKEPAFFTGSEVRLILSNISSQVLFCYCLNSHVNMPRVFN